jgi:hypothetical protein
MAMFPECLLQAGGDLLQNCPHHPAPIKPGLKESEVVAQPDPE